jgi:hypothetical protein
MKLNLKALNKLVEEKGMSDNTEVTWFKNKYHLLHILRNGVPIPYVISRDATEIKNYIERLA